MPEDVFVLQDEFMKITYGVTPMDSPPGSQMSEITQKVQSASTSPGQVSILLPCCKFIHSAVRSLIKDTARLRYMTPLILV